MQKYFDLVGINELDEPADSMQEVSFWSCVNRYFRLERYEGYLELITPKGNYVLRPSSKLKFGGICNNTKVTVQFKKNWISATLSFL